MPPGARYIASPHSGEAGYDRYLRFAIPYFLILLVLALIITKTQVSTLPIELSKYQGSTEGRVYGRQAALAVGITIPLMVVGLIIRKHLARGFSFGMVRR